jgi:hypothetical protein
MTPSGTRGALNDVLSIYFADAALASAFVEPKLPLLLFRIGPAHDCPLFVQPNVFQTKIVNDAVDHHRPIFHLRPPTVCKAVIEDDWPGAVFRQVSFDLPYQLLAPAFVGFR